MDRAFLHRIGLLAVVVAAGGCSYYRPIAVSTSSLGPMYEVPIGYVEGKATNAYLFGIQGRQESMRQAIEEAKRKVGADNIINISVDERITFYPFTLLPLICSVETIVHGTAVRYKEAAAKPLTDFTTDSPVSPEKTDAPPPKVPPVGVF